MPDHPRPSSPVPETEPGEFNFAQPATEHPRMKRRSLKAQPAAAPLSGAAPPAPPADAPRPDEQPPAPDAIAPAKSYFRTTVQPSPNPSPSQPSTLYYSTGARKEKADAPPMKPSSPSGTPSSPHAASSPGVRTTPAAAAARPAAAAPMTGAAPASSVRATAAAPTTGLAPAMRSATAVPTGTAAAPARAASVVDYRANIERQAREQKSVGSLIHYVVYLLGAVLLFGFALAGYGTYVLSRQIHQQSVTMSDLDSRYAAQNKAIATHIAGTDDTVAQAQADIRRQQEMILRQQEDINNLLTENQAATTALRQEHASRVAEDSHLRAEAANLRDEDSSLRSRVRALEDQPHLSR